MLNLSFKEKENVFLSVENVLKEAGFIYDNEKYALVYAAYLCKEKGIQSQDDFEKKVLSKMSADRKLFVSSVTRQYWKIIENVLETLSDDDILTFLKYWNGEASMFTGVNATPRSEVALLGKLLEIKNNESFADLGSGFGSFTELIGDSMPSTKYYGVEIQANYKEIPLIKSELFGFKAQVECRDMFAIDRDLTFDKIVADPPLGIKPIMLRDSDVGLYSAMYPIVGIEKATSYTWPIAALMLKHLKEQGKAIEVVAMGALFNSVEKEIRKYFVENNLISTIIALPNRLTTAHGIQTALVVFERTKKDYIRIIDAREEFVFGRRQNSLSDENIDNIVKAIDAENEISKSVSFAEIRENDYALNPERYFQEKIVIKDGVKLETVVKITRGASINASQLDDMASDIPTNTQYLMLADIQDGIIKSDLPYLKDLDEKYEKYLVHDKNIILSKIGTPFKNAIAHVEKGKNVLGSGNVYIIQVDESKLNPYFLKAFLESEVGTASLKRASAGATIPNISLSALRHLIIPLPSMDIQEKIAKDYQLKEDEIKVLTRRLEKTQNELKQVYREEDSHADN